MLQIRTAEKTDYQTVRDFYYSLTDAMEDAEFKPGWEKDIYPSQEFLLHSIEKGELYLGMEDGKPATCMVINHEYNESYRQICWPVQIPDSKLLVIHALGVHPDFSHRGFAGEMVRWAIRLAHKQQIQAIRLDVLSGNLPAEKVYTRLGFQYRGTIRMYYEDTGWTDYRIFELLLPPDFTSL